MLICYRFDKFSIFHTLISTCLVHLITDTEKKSVLGIECTNTNVAGAVCKINVSRRSGCKCTCLMGYFYGGIKVSLFSNCLCSCIPQINTSDPRPPIPPHVMASSTIGLSFRVIRFLQTMHAKTNAKPLRPRPSCNM